MACCLTEAAWGAGTWLPREGRLWLCWNRVSLAVRAGMLAQQPSTKPDHWGMHLLSSSERPEAG